MASFQSKVLHIAKLFSLCSSQTLLFGCWHINAADVWICESVYSIEYELL